MAVLHETELYIPLKRFFELRGYEVKSEVRFCDLVAIHPDQQEPVIVEIKKTFNLPLLLQGLQRQKISRFVYLAVERNRTKKGAHNQRWSEITELCRRLGLGLLTVTLYKTKEPFVEVLCQPEGSGPEGMVGPPLRQLKPRTRRLLNEFHERSGDYNLGGSTGRKLYTAYREKALRVAKALSAEPEMSPAKAKSLSGVSAAAAILQNNYYGWFLRVRRGVYLLTPAGHEALREYEELLGREIEQQGI